MSDIGSSTRVTWTLTAAGALATAAAVLLIGATVLFGGFVQWLVAIWTDSPTPIHLELGPAVGAIWADWAVLMIAGPALLMAAGRRVLRSPGSPSFVTWLSVTLAGLAGTLLVLGLAIIVLG
jgi:hypothetical protein